MLATFGYTAGCHKDGAVEDGTTHYSARPTIVPTGMSTTATAFELTSREDGHTEHGDDGETCEATSLTGLATLKVAHLVDPATLEGTRLSDLATLETARLDDLATIKAMRLTEGVALEVTRLADLTTLEATRVVEVTTHETPGGVARHAAALGATRLADLVMITTCHDDLATLGTTVETAEIATLEATRLAGHRRSRRRTS